MVEALAGIAAILRTADPIDKAEVYRQLGLRLTYKPGLRVIAAEANPSGSCTSLCPRGELNPYDRFPLRTMRPNGFPPARLDRRRYAVGFWQDPDMTEIPARLSIVTLGARDMGVLRSFYRALGWPELPAGDDTWTGFLLGGVLLALFPLRDLSAEAASGSAEPTGWSGVTLACTVDTRDSVDSAFAAAVAAGAHAVAKASDRPWGGRSAFIADPEGNRWEITWGPRAAFDERGALLAWG